MFEKTFDLVDPASDEGDLEEEEGEEEDEEEEDEDEDEEEQEEGEEDEKEEDNDGIEEDDETQESENELSDKGKKVPENKEKLSKPQSKKPSDKKNVNGNDIKSPIKDMAKLTGLDGKRMIKRPDTSVIVEEAIKFLKERKGSSMRAIEKFAMNNYADINKIYLMRSLKKYLPTAVANGILIQTSGKGASGSFKLSAEILKKNAIQAKAVKKKEKEKVKEKQKVMEKKEKEKEKEKAKKLKLQERAKNLKNNKKLQKTKPNVDKIDAAQTETAVKEKTKMKKKVETAVAVAAEDKMKEVTTKGPIQPARKSISIPARALQQPKPKLALKLRNKKAKNAPPAAVETEKVTRKKAKT